MARRLAPARCAPSDAATKSMVAHGAEHPDEQQGPHSDACEPVRPRREEQAGEDQHRAGKGRQHDPRKADGHEGHGEEPQQDGQRKLSASISSLPSSSICE